MSTGKRAHWGSRLGFILAASGSAIGLGNIVFFSASAYKGGGGAFYVPYLIALFLVGVPVLAAEFGLGRAAGGAFPQALGKYAGKTGEFFGWWGIANALTITMYYISLLAWVTGMGVLSLTGTLWEPQAQVPAFDVPEHAMANPTGSFFALISSPWVLCAVVFVWAANVWLVLRGTQSIERAVTWMMPTLWIVMGALAIGGLMLPGGTDGLWMLVTPDFGALRNFDVWKGAFSQIFFTLSLGFGVMSAYSSYLPADSDDVANSSAVAGLNCLFELVAGIAVFSILASFALTPKASTLAMMFFIVPKGIALLPFGVVALGTLFFALLLLAGLTSSISLIEAAISAIIDKFGYQRRHIVAGVAGVGLIGSFLFALPTVIDPGLNANGTVGLSLLDYVDHYANGYGLMLVGLIECIIIGWLLPVESLMEVMNRTSRLQLGRPFAWLIRYIVPAILGTLLIVGAWTEFQSGTLYGASPSITNGLAALLPTLSLLGWLVFTFGFAAVLTLRNRPQDSQGGAA
jgi:neurotransmitter:Na+ symporter, NSS family